MKKTMLILSSLLLSALALGQDTLGLPEGPAPKVLDKAEGRYNAAQPHLPLEGRRVFLHVHHSDGCELEDTDLDSIEATLQRAGADTYRDRDDLPYRKGDIRDDVSVSMKTGRREDLSGYISTFLSGYNLAYSGEASVTTITSRLSDRKTGSTKGYPIIKVMAVARDTDHLAMDIVGRLSQQAGLEYNAEDRAGREQESFNKAVAKLDEVTLWKCQSESREARH